MQHVTPFVCGFVILGLVARAHMVFKLRHLMSEQTLMWSCIDRVTDSIAILFLVYLALYQLG